MLHPLSPSSMRVSSGLPSTVAASGLSLLKIAGDVSGLKHYTFAKDPAELQRNVYTLRAASDLAASNVVGGTLASVEAAQSSSSPSLKSGSLSWRSMLAMFSFNCSMLAAKERRT